MTRASAKYAISSSRASHTATSVATDRVVQPRVRSDTGPTACRATTAVLIAITSGIVWRVQIDPVLGGLFAISELRRLRLADEDHTTIKETLNGRCSLVLGRVEIVEGAVATSGVKALDVINILHAETKTGERFLRGGREVETRGHGDALSGSPRGVGVELRKPALAIRYGPVEEGLLLVLVKAKC